MQYESIEAAITDAYVKTIKQGQPAVSINDSCEYRTGNLKCALGQIISDDLALRLGKRVASEMTDDEVLEVVPNADPYFARRAFRRIQSAHDEAWMYGIPFLDSFRKRAITDFPYLADVVVPA